MKSSPSPRFRSIFPCDFSIRGRRWRRNRHHVTVNVQKLISIHSLWIVHGIPELHCCLLALESHFMTEEPVNREVVTQCHPKLETRLYDWHCMQTQLIKIGQLCTLQSVWSIHSRLNFHGFLILSKYIFKPNIQWWYLYSTFGIFPQQSIKSMYN